jgi:hypothetical protein
VEKKLMIFFSRDVLWPPKVIANTSSYRSHVISLFDFGGKIFQPKTSLTVGVTRELLETINSNKANCTCGK